MARKQNRRSSPQRRRRSGNHYNFKVIFTVAVIVVLICSIAYSTCRNRAWNDSMNEAAQKSPLHELTVVRTVDTEDGQMLHYPGFDVFFSNRHRQPYYSAWILTPEHAADKSVARSDNFRPDPNVPNSPQLSDYKRSGYDRGHMAPSADFRYSAEAQSATFFLTNMSPQHNNLNGRAWANLEEQCRNWALRDSSIVIIAGPILSDYLTQTIGENRITVPDRYFKVVYAPYANPPRAIGFIMPNQTVPGGVQASAVSVDEVEAVTGFDFFSALPDELEDQIESRADYSVWQRGINKKKKTRR